LILIHITFATPAMSQVDSTVVRQTIEEHEPIRDIELNFLLAERGIELFDAIVLQDIFE